MADSDSTSGEVPEAEQHDSAAHGRRPLLARLGVAGFVLIVIVVECAAAYLYLPSSSEATAIAAAAPKPAEAAPVENETAGEGEAEGPAQTEVDLGEFSVTAFQPTSNSTLRIDFHLFGTIRASEDKEFTRLMEESKHRFREQVLMTVRSAEITDVADPSLGLIKRQLLDKTNRTLGKPLLQSVIISDFSFVEQ
jgi:flagellar FliL protein